MQSIEALQDQALNTHMMIQVANGGYIVHAWVKGDKTWEVATNVYSSVETLASGVARMAMAIEGGDSTGDTLGPLTLPRDNA
jgi:hypothetical protein